MGDCERLFRQAVDRRAELSSGGSTTAWRAVSGDADGVPGVYADVYGGGAVMNLYEGRVAAGFDVRTAAEDLLGVLKTLGVRAVYPKRFVRDRSRLGGELMPELYMSDPVAAGGAGETVGEPDPDSSTRGADGRHGGGIVIVSEGTLRFEVRLWDGLSTGLFVDQRENRAWVSAGSKGKRVLNTFAYTCGFSAAAAVAGASEVTSVDVSGKYLEWGKRNFILNGIDPARHRFARMDTFEFFNYARRKGFQYDLIILDPPSFGSADRKTGRRAWSAVEGYSRLVSEATGLLNRGGLVLASTNNTELCAPGRLQREVTAGLGSSGLRPQWVRTPEVGVDVRRERGRFSATAFSV